MKTDKILFIDTETGGLDPLKNSLLSVAFVIWQNFKIIDYKEILINDGILNSTPQALQINGIDLENHRNTALKTEFAIEEINKFINSHFTNDEKITLAGHNVNFDVNFLKHFLSANNFPFHKRFSHRYIDTATILYYLYLSGKLKQKAISSQEAFDLFHINVDRRHTALGDALATAKLFSVLLRKVYRNVKIKDEKEQMHLLFEYDPENKTNSQI